jgi:hypothetical protein
MSLMEEARQGEQFTHAFCDPRKVGSILITTITTSDIRVVIIKIDINISLNNCTIVNKGTERATTDIVYNKVIQIVQTVVQ